MISFFVSVRLFFPSAHIYLSHRRRIEYVAIFKSSYRVSEVPLGCLCCCQTFCTLHAICIEHTRPAAEWIGWAKRQDVALLHYIPPSKVSNHSDLISEKNMVTMLHAQLGVLDGEGFSRNTLLMYNFSHRIPDELSLPQNMEANSSRIYCQ